MFKKFRTTGKARQVIIIAPRIKHQQTIENLAIDFATKSGLERKSKLISFFPNIISSGNFILK
jgi:hypothetical protein